MGAGVILLVAVEVFLEISKAGPRVVGASTLGGDAPEVKGLESLFLSVEDELNGEDPGGVKFATFVRLGALEIIPRAVIVENETGGDDTF